MEKEKKPNFIQKQYKKVKRIIKKIWLFIRKEERKVVSLISLPFKIGISLFVVLILPIAYFLILLYIGPRSIPTVNKYIEDKLLKKYEENISFSLKNSKLGFNRSWNFTFNIEDVSIALPDRKDTLKFPTVVLEIDLWHLLLKKIVLDNVTLSDSSIRLVQDGVKATPIAWSDGPAPLPLPETEAKPNGLEKIYNTILLIDKHKLPIRGISLKDFNVILVRKGVEKNILIKHTNARFNFRSSYVELEMNSLVNLNKKSKNVTLTNACTLFQNKSIFCDLEFYNLNTVDTAGLLKDYVAIIQKYEKNINTDLSGRVSFLFENYVTLKESEMELFALKGDFDFKQFFSQKIDFSNLVAKASINDNFNRVELKSLETLFGRAKFRMSFKFKKGEEFNDIYAKYETEDLPIENLQKLWPTFLNKNGIRDWIVGHMSKGMVTSAYAEMHQKYNKASKLTEMQKIDSDVYFTGATLNYSDKFPNPDRLDGVATFRKDDMVIKINSGQIINTKILEGGIKCDFTKPIRVLDMNAKTQGKASDLFAHANNNDKKTRSVVDAFFDGQTNSIINLKIPLGIHLDFYNATMDIYSNIINNNTSYFNHNSNIAINLVNKAESRAIEGKMDFLNSEIYSALLGLKKAKGDPTNIVFDILNKATEVEIVKLEPQDSAIKFTTTGRIIKNDGSKSIQVKDVNYGNFQYDIFYNTVPLNGKKEEVLTVTSSQFDLKEFIDSFRRFEQTKKKGIGFNIENLRLKAKMANIALKNNKSIIDSTIEMICENNVCGNFELNGFTKADRSIKLSVLTKDLEKPNEKRIKLVADDFGYLIDGLDISNKVIDGKGEIKADLTIEEETGMVFKGTLDIPNKFSLIINNTFSTKVTDDLLREDLLPELRKEILANNITFSKVKSDFKFANNKLTVKDMLLSSSNIAGIGITVNGEIYVDTGKMRLEGLIIPAETLNSLFGLTKIPLIGSLIDKGVFASPYQLHKNSYREETVVNIQKELTVAPGVMRRLFGKKEKPEESDTN